MVMRNTKGIDFHTIVHRLIKVLDQLCLTDNKLAGKGYTGMQKEVVDSFGV